MKIKYLLLILIPLFIIFFNLNNLIFNYPIKNKDVNENLLNYFKGKEGLKFNYSERELIHLNDVKKLITILRITIYFVFLLIIILFFTDNNISHILIVSGLLTILIILILLLSDFNSLFTKFHETLFTNNYWLLDKDSLLIKTYPIEFFIGFFKRLVLNITITSLIVIGIGIIQNVHKQHKSSNI